LVIASIYLATSNALWIGDGLATCHTVPTGGAQQSAAPSSWIILASGPANSCCSPARTAAGRPWSWACPLRLANLLSYNCPARNSTTRSRSPS